LGHVKVIPPSGKSGLTGDAKGLLTDSSLSLENSVCVKSLSQPRHVIIHRKITSLLSSKGLPNRRRKMHFSSLKPAVISYADGIAEHQFKAHSGAVCVVFGIVLKQPGNRSIKSVGPGLQSANIVAAN